MFSSLICIYFPEMHLSCKLRYTLSSLGFVCVYILSSFLNGIFVVVFFLCCNVYLCSSVYVFFTLATSKIFFVLCLYRFEYSISRCVLLVFWGARYLSCFMFSKLLGSCGLMPDINFRKFCISSDTSIFLLL